MTLVLLAVAIGPNLTADTVTIQMMQPPLIITDSGTVNSNAVITPASDGWSVAFDPIYSSPAYSETLEILVDFNVPENALFTLETDATATLVGSGCSHGFCPGINLSLLGEAMVSSADAVTAQFSEKSAGPASFFSTATASGSGSQTFDIAAGNYVLVQVLSINATDAGVWSQMTVNANVTLQDPPSEVPEARWSVLLLPAVLFGARLALRRAHLTRFFR